MTTAMTIGSRLLDSCGFGGVRTFFVFIPLEKYRDYGAGRKLLGVFLFFLFLVRWELYCSTVVKRFAVEVSWCKREHKG